MNRDSGFTWPSYTLCAESNIKLNNIFICGLHVNPADFFAFPVDKSGKRVYNIFKD